MTPAEWDRHYRISSLVGSGMPGEIAEAITNLLLINSMVCYEGCGDGETEWRVQYRRHLFKVSQQYIAVRGPRYELASWLRAVKEVEDNFGHIS